MQKKSLLLFSIFLCLNCYAQMKEDLYFNAKDSLLKAYKKKGQLDSLAIKAHKFTLDYNKKREYQKALFFAKKEVNCKNVLSDSLYKNALFNLGFFYYKTNQYYKSNVAFKKVIDSFKTDKKTYQSYCYIGRSLNKLGDYYQAISYYKKGLKKGNSFSPRNFFNHYVNLSIVYQNTDTEEGLRQKSLLLQKADSISRITTLSYSNYRSLFNNYGLLYKHDLMFDFKKAKHYYGKLIEMAKTRKDTSTLISTYNNLGGLYNVQKNDSANFYLNKGLEMVSLDSKAFSILQNNLAEYFHIKKNTIKALKHLHLGLQSTIPTTIDPSHLFVPSLNHFSLSNNKVQAFFTLKDKVDYILNGTTTNANNKMVLVALRNIILADKLLDVIKQESLETNSKLFWQEEASELYLFAANACYRLNKPEQAFYFMEKNKAILLLENINENEMKTLNNVPAVFLEKELELKYNIHNLENELNASKGKKNDLENKYHSLKIDYKNLVESLKKEYPQYYDYKTQARTLNLEETKSRMGENALLIEYTLNEKDGYLLMVSKEETSIHKIDSVPDLNTKIEVYLSLISKPLKTKTDLENYSNLSKELHSILLPFLKDQIEKGKTKLLIIPDHRLQYIPFETLKRDNIESSLLIEDFDISYAYSYSFLEKNKAINREPDNDFVGFAPFKFEYDNLQDLTRSKTEVNAIKDILQGETFIGNVATKQNFFSRINNSKIIHLATHANANDSISPWIAFKDKKLFLNELYTVKNQAELVVLSACKSSLGKLNDGEGVFSLARGFFQSGSNSVISSLWNVNDKSNEKITSSFYSHLKEGEPRSNALRLAKLDYLKTHSLSETSPYYWSSLVLVGDNSPIDLPPYNHLFFIALPLILLLTLLFYLKKRKTSG